MYIYIDEDHINTSIIFIRWHYRRVNISINICIYMHNIHVHIYIYICTLLLLGGNYIDHWLFPFGYSLFPCRAFHLDMAQVGPRGEGRPRGRCGTIVDLFIKSDRFVIARFLFFLKTCFCVI